jgi:hypothetical protein
LEWLRPQIPSQPWTAPAYASLQVPSKPPRIFCWSSGLKGQKIDCKCRTEQNTKYALDLETCLIVVNDGQYEPFLDIAEGQRAQNAEMQLQHNEDSRYINRSSVIPTVEESTPSFGAGIKTEPYQVGQPAKNVRGWIRNY